MDEYCPADPWPPESFWIYDDPEDAYSYPFTDTSADDPEIRAALDAAGYGHEPGTNESLVFCFLDYVAAGYWRDLCLEEAQEGIKSGEISTRLMIYALRRG